ncbi:OmpH family outer membrane protein [Kushneria phosphatilytica]|uniref:OmpH family outer membrane protein n=1 Tax=Kushneria phosphatilytica TaxID=657387 RepID=A0A1S1NV80_9GAMM|nr:OmpH family outer membrane protein [Kushneria phosphatilytica]OHV10478.1 molecular chaperone Skp [Kushneria phosphatilytica]QEL11969.1 OmpH family outer membrane protein [Kushneria phosphatilytica]
MRKIAALCLASILGTLSMAAQAADVAVLDWREALMNTTAAQHSMNQLKNQLGNKPQQVKQLGQQVQQLQKRLQQNGDVMSDNERQNLAQQLRQKGTQFQQQRQQLEQQRQQAEQSFLKQAKPKLDKAIEQVVQRHHVQVLVDRQSVIYSDDSLDLTKEVTNTFNSLQ